MRWASRIIDVIGRAMRSVDHERAFVLVTDEPTFSPLWPTTSPIPNQWVDQAPAVNAVYTCVRLRATLLSSLPLKFYRITRSGKDEVTTGPVVDLFSKVNPFWTWSRLVEMIEWSLCLWGSAYVFLERGASGRQTPRELWWARSDRVRVVPDRTQYLSGFVYVAPNGEEIRFDPQETWWLRYPNPLDEFSGLSPLGAAWLAADAAQAAMQANRNLFLNGIQAGGFIAPKAGSMPFSTEQQALLTETLRRDWKGVNNAHRWFIFDRDIDVKQLSLSPKDAEFLGLLRWSLEDVARAYGVPLDLIGGQRTYENVNAAHLAVWTNTIIPEARFIASEITEQILPLFPGGPDIAEFDLSQVPILREAEEQRWSIAREQIAAGALTINEWRTSVGLSPLPWGDVWWAPNTLIPATGGETQAAAQEPRSDQAADLLQRLAAPRVAADAPAFGSPEHIAMLARLEEFADPLDDRVRKLLIGLFRRQRRAMIDRLSTLTERGYPDGIRQDAEEILRKIFILPRWNREFQQTALRMTEDGQPEGFVPEVVEAAGQQVIAEVLADGAFDVLDPEVVRAMTQQAQKFAREVNETTWNALKASLTDGLIAGEGIPQLQNRVVDVMGVRMGHAEAIARTEVTRAITTGSIHGARQSGVITHKIWIATMDGRTRPEHFRAHGQRRKLHEDFVVGGATGPGPGALSTAEMSVNCRCTLHFVTDIAGD